MAEVGPSGGTSHEWVAPETPAESREGAVETEPSIAAAVRPRPAAPTTGGPRLPVPLRPMTASDVLDGAFAIVKLRPRTVIGFTAALVIPIQLLAAWATRGQLGDVFEVSTDPASSQLLASDAGLSSWTDVLLIYVGVLPLPFVGAFLARLVSSWYGGGDPPTRELARAVLHSAPTLLAVFVVVHLVETVAVLLAVIPFVFVAPLFMCTAPVVGAEGVGPGRAVRRSVQLAARRYWRSVLVLVYSLVISTVLSVAFGIGPLLLAESLGSTWGWIPAAVGSGLAELVVTPVVAGAAVLHYLDLRVRTEGLDLELRAMAVFGTSDG